jgi:hypothetical protein
MTFFVQFAKKIEKTHLIVHVSKVILKILIKVVFYLKPAIINVRHVTCKILLCVRIALILQEI